MLKHFRSFTRKFIDPRSNHPDEQRREFVFNVIICLFTLAAAAALLSSGINHLVGNSAHKGNSLPVTVLFLAVTTGLWRLSRRGHYKVGAYVLVAILWLATLQLTLAWSFVLPMAQLLDVLVIVVSGIILSAQSALLVTALVTVATVAIGYLQIHHVLIPNTAWLTQPLELSDAIGLAVIFSIVGVIAWLANREIDMLLRRAWKSEAALTKERDQLEVTVSERTQELQRTQLQRVLELQNFAEFGRISASLIHDLASPLTAATLNLEQLQQDRPEVVDQAMTSIRHLERYVLTARKQLQGKSQPQAFHVSDEVEQVKDLLTRQAQAAGIGLELTMNPGDLAYGDPVAFSRVTANLIVNAIHAYADAPANEQVILLAVSSRGKTVVLTIQDFGVGIKSKDLPHIFQEFYSTKKRVGRGLGIGLATAKQVIEHDFNGHINVTSTPEKGTLFTIAVPIYEPKNSTKSQTRHKLPKNPTK